MLKRIVNFLQKYFIYLISVIFLYFLAGFILGQMPLPNRKEALMVSDYMCKYIELNGQMPQSKEDLLAHWDLLKPDTNHNATEPCYNELSKSLELFDISYGVNLGNIIFSQGDLIDTNTKIKVLLIDSDYSLTILLRAKSYRLMYERLSEKWYRVHRDFLFNNKDRVP